MAAQQFQLQGCPDRPAQVHAWLPSGAPRAVVQIIHGMAEHGARYARLGAALSAAGYAVYAQDLPGHGGSVASAADLGLDDVREGWAITQAAVHALRGELQRRHPGAPLFLLGHSRGSFVLQHYLFTQAQGLAGAILSASTADMGPLRAAGLALIRLEALLRGRAHRSALAQALTFGDFNRRFKRRFKPNRTDFDWLSRDTVEVDQYVSDPLCGFQCAASMWIDLLAAGRQLRDPTRLAGIPATLPVLLLNGSEDAAARGVAGARSLERAYRGAGLRDLTLRLYAGARHELLNDTCRDAVTADLLAWLDARC